MTTELRVEYESRYQNVLVPVAHGIEQLLTDHLKGVERVDRISVRAKTSKSFMDKALKKNSDGSARYDDPLAQVQDQIGARIIMFFLEDVQSACDQVLRYFTHVEELVKEPKSEWEFGYFGRHLVLALPPDAVPRDIDRGVAPRLFELQVRTLFQHAWSEAEHDIGYKAISELTDDQQRRLAFASAQAWGADRIFQELHDELRLDPKRTG